MIEAGFHPETIQFINIERDLNVYHEGDAAASCCAETVNPEKGYCTGTTKVRKR